MPRGNRISRRKFLLSTTKAMLAAGMSSASARRAPAAGRRPPNERIGLGFIGVGRQAQGHLRAFCGSPRVQGIAVCDVDANRREAARKTVASIHAAETKNGTYSGCAAYGDFRELLARDDIDAVVIVTPDHWHVLNAIEAARTGKDVYIEKPLSLTIAGGRALADAVHRYGRVLQVGSQLRSNSRTRFACELVRNGRIGRVLTVKVGLPGERTCGPQPVMPVPQELDYDFWLGPAPRKPYTMHRVHPRGAGGGVSYGRPGWLRVLDYGSGMITGWGSHDLDIAQWGLGTEHTGPVEVAGRGSFPRDGLWDVPTDFFAEYTYADGARLLCSNRFPVGVRFEGTDGWVFAPHGGSPKTEPESLARSVVAPGEIHLYESRNHRENFLDGVETRTQPVAPAEVGHRSATVCHLGHIAMVLGRRLRWDPDRECFVNDPEANRMVWRPMREPWCL